MDGQIPPQSQPPPYEVYEQRYAKEHAGYDQPPAAYPAQPPQQMVGYGQGQGYVQQHQQNVTIQQPVAGTSSQVVIVSHQEPLPQMGGYIALACVVFWLCNCLFGAIAFFIALGGQSATSAAEARTAGKTSLGVSIAGIIISVIVLAIAIPLFIHNANEIYN